MPEINLDTAAIAQAWQRARDAMIATLRQKANAPLERATLGEGTRAAVTDYLYHDGQVAALSQRLEAANTVISGVKQRAAGANVATLAGEVARLLATRARHGQQRPRCARPTWPKKRRRSRPRISGTRHARP